MSSTQRYTPWTAHDAIHLYGLDRWGRDYFSVNRSGNLVVHTESSSGQPVHYDLADVVARSESMGLPTPLIVRFPGIIRQRIRQINDAFTKAIEDFSYRGSYRCIYPIKVNQHAEVIDSVLQMTEPYCVGLESGSKAELLTVIARADQRTKILCNGFKDRSVIEMIQWAQQIGRDITVVIEKPSEVELIADVVKQFPFRPQLGIRVKLGWRGAGHWQSSNGPRSKFGLTATELIAALRRLRELDLIDQVHLLHFHPGSQINDVREIKTALIEVTRVYVDLVKQGVPLNTIDVGGGLAVDYTGNQNKNSSSMNYTLNEYANDVVYYIQMVCNQAGVPHPELYSESGRAIVAHHSMLVVPVFATSDQTIGDDQSSALQVDFDPHDQDTQPLDELNQILGEVDRRLLGDPKKLEQRFFSEAYHDAQQALETALQLFVNGHLSLARRSQAESLFFELCRKIRGVLNVWEFVPEELLELRDVLADTYFANFSVFQSLPDFWALSQLFPIMPIHRLDERPERRGVIGDITCDSDGLINCFLGDKSDQLHSLPLHSVQPGKPYWLGVFLVGAYQEALSDDHNLLGKFHTVSIDDFEESSQAAGHSPLPYQMTCLTGSRLQDVIEQVKHDWGILAERFRLACAEAIDRGAVDQATSQAAVNFFNQLSQQYTYLERDQVIVANRRVAEALGAGSHLAVGRPSPDAPSENGPSQREPGQQGSSQEEQCAQPLQHERQTEGTPDEDLATRVGSNHR